MYGLYDVYGYINDIDQNKRDLTYKFGKKVYRQCLSKYRSHIKGSGSKND